MYAERTPPGTPPCETCRVELLEENEDTATIYMLTRKQVITAEQGQIIDISIPAVKIAMDMHGGKDQKECLQNVRHLFYYFENKRRENAS